MGDMISFGCFYTGAKIYKFGAYAQARRYAAEVKERHRLPKIHHPIQPVDSQRSVNGRTGSQPYVRSEATRVHEVEHPDDGDGGGGVHSHRVVVAYTYPSVEG